MREVGLLSREPPKCIFRLHERCLVWEVVGEKLREEGIEFGSKEFVKVYCGLCIKAVYAKAHLSRAENIKVVNTL